MESASGTNLQRVLAVLVPTGVAACILFFAVIATASDPRQRGAERRAGVVDHAALVTGDAGRMRSVVAGTPPSADFLLTPAPPKIGSYPAGCAIRDQRLFCPVPQSGFRLWLEMQLRDWDPNQDGSPPLGGGQTFIEGGFLGTEAVPPNPGVDLVFPTIPCQSSSECNVVLGETWARC